VAGQPRRVGRRGAPQPQRLAGQVGGGRVAGPVRGAGPLHQAAEPEQVDAVRAEVEPVPGAGRGQQPAGGACRPVRFQDPAQVLDVRLDDVGRRPRWTGRPQRGDELVEPERPATGERQPGENGAPLRASQLEVDPVARHAYPAQQPHPKLAGVHPAPPPWTPRADPCGPVPGRHCAR
jgi:hypothetical protein